jgi:DNA modification methylase
LASRRTESPDAEARVDRRERRSLSHVGGESVLAGDPALAAELARALAVNSSGGAGEGVSPEGEDETRTHVHGFHTYPARMHPATASRLVAAFSREGQVVLDPFCGSGTVLVEARLLKRRAIGVDANPLAVRLARRKAVPAYEAELASLTKSAEQAAAVATERRKAKSGASKRYPPPDMEAFDAHVLLELDGLKVGLAALEDRQARATLELVLSSILIKLSRRRGDTAAGTRETRLAAGYPTRLFVKKTAELVGLLSAAAPALALGPRADVFEDDARVMRDAVPESVDLVVTSPPYPGVYDYVEHHRLRLRWLGLKEHTFAENEIGARRDLSKLGTAAAGQAFETQMTDVLAALSRVLTKSGRAIFLVADGAHGESAIRTDAVITRAAAARGFQVAAIASQSRPHFHAPTSRAFAERPRYEHAILLARDPRRAK